MMQRALLALAVVAVAAPQLMHAASPAPCLCPSNALRLTCGTDGLTYTNPCLLRCAARLGTSPKKGDLEVAHDGPCEPRKPASGVAPQMVAEAAKPMMRPCLCTMDISHVCGSDGVTYTNPCVLDCAAKREKLGTGLKVAHQGRCVSDVIRASLPLPSVHLPVVLDADVKAKQGCLCTRELQHMCGTDNVTYANRCLLDCAARQGTSTQGAALAVAHVGRCAQKVRKEAKPVHRLCRCAMLWHPVCGSDGLTYSNECDLGCARGRQTSVQGADLKMVHEGEC